jgi:hypothetical protein
MNPRDTPGRDTITPTERTAVLAAAALVIGLVLAKRPRRR